MTAKALRSIKKTLSEGDMSVAALLGEHAGEGKQQLQERTAANSIISREKEEYLTAVNLLETYQGIPETGDRKKDFEKVRKQFGRVGK